MTDRALYEQTCRAINPVSKTWLDKAGQRLDSLTKPRRSLGYLEEIAARVVAVLQQEHPGIEKKRIFVFVGDHKVVEEGVSAYPAEVTGLMVKNFLAGGAAINVLARQARAEIEVITVGMAEDPGQLPGLLNFNIKRGADNIARGPAMTTEETLRAIAVGIQRAEAAIDQGVSMLASGDMGIGNTTPSTALFAVLLDLPVADMVGPGTGLDRDGIRKKKQVVEKAIAVNKAVCANPLGTLSALGGLEIAALCGLYLGAAARSRIAVVDGFISSAAALAAMRMAPAVKDYLFFSHMSAEPGHRLFFAQEKLRPIIDLDMRLGEGTGAAIAMQIIEDAVAIYNEMATFSEANIAPGA